MRLVVQHYVAGCGPARRAGPPITVSKSCKKDLAGSLVEKVRDLQVWYSFQILHQMVRFCPLVHKSQASSNIMIAKAKSKQIHCAQVCSKLMLGHKQQVESLLVWIEDDWSVLLAKKG
jgi:hypothetical protein